MNEFHFEKDHGLRWDARGTTHVTESVRMRDQKARHFVHFHALDANFESWDAGDRKRECYGKMKAEEEKQQEDEEEQEQEQEGKQKRRK